MKRHYSFGLTPEQREEFEREAYRATRPLEIEIDQLNDQLDAAQITPWEYGYQLNLLYSRIQAIRNMIYADFEKKYLNF